MIGFEGVESGEGPEGVGLGAWIARGLELFFEEGHGGGILLLDEKTLGFGAGPAVRAL